MRSNSMIRAPGDWYAGGDSRDQTGFWAALWPHATISGGKCLVFRCFPFQLQVLQIVISMKSQVWTVDLCRFMVDIWYEICIDMIDLKSKWDGPNRDAQHGSRNTDLAGRAFNPDGKTHGVEAAGILANPPAEGFQWNSNDFQNVKKKTSQKGHR